jgi:hypothetical protein
MRTAIEERKRQKRRVAAINAILRCVEKVLPSQTMKVVDASVAVKWFVRDSNEEKDVTSATVAY